MERASSDATEPEGTIPPSNDRAAPARHVHPHADWPKFPVWSDAVRGYLHQQISQAANAKERADAVRLAQRLAQAS